MLVQIKPVVRKATEFSTAAIALATALGSQMLTDEFTAVELAIRIAVDAIASTSAMDLQIDKYVEDLRAGDISSGEGLRVYENIRHELQEKQEVFQEKLHHRKWLTYIASLTRLA
jgi:hypothetical protein